MLEKPSSQLSTLDHFVCFSCQAERPNLPDPVLGAALQSEYTSKYTTKADATKVNFRFLWSAYFAGRQTRTPEQVRDRALGSRGGICKS
jgi:hypothetical protein